MKIQDAFGREIRLGDFVTYRRSYGGMAIGLVEKMVVKLSRYGGDTTYYISLRVSSEGWKSTYDRVTIYECRNLVVISPEYVPQGLAEKLR